MTHEGGASGEKPYDDCERRARMTKDLDGEEGGPYRAYNGVDRVPDRIDPGNLVREKFEKVENSGNADDPRVSQHFQGLVIGRERDPVEMNGQSGNENR